MAIRVVGGVVRARMPIAGVAVSNGETIVETTRRGLFELPVDSERHSTVFATLPDGYQAAGRFYRDVADFDAAEQLEFRLTKAGKRRRGAFLHIADTHLVASSRNADGPRELARQLRGLRNAEREAGMIVATGDLTNRGDSESLQEWQRITSRAHGRFVSVFGGHDGNWERKHPEGSPLPWARNWERHVAPMYYSFEWCGYHFTVYLGEDHFLGRQRSLMRDRWLRLDLLRVQGRLPTIVLTHTPPSAAFVRRLARYGVVAVFYGHWHSSKAHAVAGVKVFSTPCLPFGAIDTRPAGYRHVRIDPNGVKARLKNVGKLADPTSPPHVWRRRIPGGAHRGGVVACGNRLLVSVCDEDLAGRPGVLALDAASGRRTWHVETDASVKNSVAVDAGLCAAVSVTGQIVVADVASGRCLWRRRMRGHPDRWLFTQPAFGAGLVVAGSAYGLEAREARTGTPIWQWKHEKVGSDAWSHYASPFVAGDRVIVPCMRVGLAALRLADGKPVWEAQGHMEYSLAQPVVAGGRIFTPFYPATLVAMDAASGSVLWKKALGEGLLSTLGVCGNTVYTVTTGGELRAHRATSGRLRWSARIGRDLLDFTPYSVNASSAWARPLIEGDRLVLACADGRLRVYGTRSGRCVRTVRFGDALTATPCLYGDRLYVASYTGVLWALPWPPRPRR